MAHLHSLLDNDPYFTIDPESRSITPLSEEEQLVLVQGDHNSEQITFEIPRYIEGHDMTLCNLVQVHYINLASDSRNKRSTGIYEIADLQVSADDENIAVCSWLISQNATMYVGSLNFVLRFVCTSGSKIDYSWSTSVYSSIPVVESIDNAGIVVDQYADVLTQWYMELMAAGTVGVNIIAEAQNGALDSIQAATNEALATIEGADAAGEITAEALENIRAAGETAVSNIDTAEAEALENIRAAGETAVSNIDTAEAEAIENIRVTTGVLPEVTTSDNGKFLRVVNGAWVAASVSSAEGVGF